MARREEPLRAWIANRYREETGLDVTSAQITLTSGSAQAIDNIAATFIAPGDVVITGAPTYPGAIRSFLARGARIVDVPQDEDGLVMTALADALASLRAAGEAVKLIYVIANYDNPSGATLPVERRIELANALFKIESRAATGERRTEAATAATTGAGTATGALTTFTGRRGASPRGDNRGARTAFGPSSEVSKREAKRMYPKTTSSERTTPRTARRTAAP